MRLDWVIIYLQALTHLEFILVWKIFHQSRDLETFSRAFGKQLVSNSLESILDGVGDLARMRTGNFGDGICLPNGIEVADLSDVISGLALDRCPVSATMSVTDRTERTTVVTHLMTKKSVW